MSKIKNLTAFVFLLSLSNLSFSSDFIIDERPNPNIGINYNLAGNDLFGGYAMYQVEKDWKYYYTHMG